MLQDERRKERQGHGSYDSRYERLYASPSTSAHSRRKKIPIGGGERRFAQREKASAACKQGQGKYIDSKKDSKEINTKTKRSLK